MWSFKKTAIGIIIIVCLSILSAFVETKLTYMNIFWITIGYGFNRLLLILCSVLLVIAAVVQDLCCSKFNNNIKSTSLFVSSSNNAFNIRKVEKQLLYETAFICFWKTINIFITSVSAVSVKFGMVSALFGIIMYGSLFISNAGALIALLFISSAAKDGLKRAFLFDGMNTMCMKLNVIGSNTSVDTIVFNA